MELTKLQRSDQKRMDELNSMRSFGERRVQLHEGGEGYNLKVSQIVGGGRGQQDARAAGLRCYLRR
jgi:hypothetical protein